MTARSRLSVAVIQGGRSSEAAVSRSSAAGVAAGLAEAGHHAVRLELDAYLSETLRSGGYDVVFPIAHGSLGEGGPLQGLLRILELPFVGSDAVASAVAMHKRIARSLFAAAGLPVARGAAFSRGDPLAVAHRARSEIGPRLVVKPSAHGSALGVTRLDASAGVDAVAAALEVAWALDDYAIVEHFARGREVTCAVLDLGEPQALAPIEILSPGDPFYTYEARYTPGRSVHVCPAELGDGIAERVSRCAVEAHRALGCRDLSRVDLIVGDDDARDAITLLEVNTLPGMTPTSLFPEAAVHAGWPFPKLCDALVRAAYARGDR